MCSFYSRTSADATWPLAVGILRSGTIRQSYEGYIHCIIITCNCSMSWSHILN